jgi:hypothetical protein
MIHNDINIDQYQPPAATIEHNIESHKTLWEQQKIERLQNKINSYGLNQEAKEMFIGAINKLKIPKTLAIQLLDLCSKNIYLIIDDSQSMATQDTELYESNNPNQLSRIEELKIRLQSIAPILSGLAKHDIKIKLLSNVNHTITLDAKLQAKEKLQIFNRIINNLQPEEDTPLTAATIQFAQDAEDQYKASGNKVSSVLYIFTDGKPTDKYIGGGQTGVLGFTSALQDLNTLKTNVLSIGFSACTGDEESIGWLTDIDQDKIIGKAINVQDDFFSEALSMYDSHSSFIPFSNYGFYIATGLLAPIVPWIDNLNEKKLLTAEQLSNVSDKEISKELHDDYVKTISDLRSKQLYQYYMPWTASGTYDSFELKILTIDGKEYRQKSAPKEAKNLYNTIYNTIYNQCTIM